MCMQLAVRATFGLRVRLIAYTVRSLLISVERLPNLITESDMKKLYGAQFGFTILRPCNLSVVRLGFFES